MKSLFWFAVLIFGLVVAGVLSFHWTKGDVQMDVHTQTLQKEAEGAVQEGRALLKKAEQSSQANPPAGAHANAPANPPANAPATPPQTTAPSHGASR